MLKNPFYYGEFEYPVGSGVWYQGKHPPLITKKLFDEVQKQLVTYPKSGWGEKIVIFKGLFKCSSCGSNIIGEEKLRKRYLDILFNPELKALFLRKAKFWQSVRNFLVAKGFIEVETPVLETTTGGADARPFETHHNALDIDVYLRISMGELWQKRLIVAGFEKTFEIGRQFRNEGMDATHNPEFTALEGYWAYQDAQGLMDYLEKDTSITVRLDKISMESDDIVYSYYTVSSSLYETKAPAMRLEYDKGAWRINAFGTYFSMDLVEKKYFDKMIEIAKKHATIINDNAFNMKMWKVGDTTYCPKFKQNYEDAKQIYEEFIALKVPPTYEEYQEAYQATEISYYENMYKSFEELYNICIAQNSKEREIHIDLFVKYFEIATSTLKEKEEITKKLEEKYQTDKEKAQN